MEKISLIDISQQLLLAVKTKEATANLLKEVKLSTQEHLIQQLKNDADKKAFWINVYNAFTQIALLENPGDYRDKKTFFGNRFIEIADKTISLDDIEHGLLRRSKLKWSLGYFSKIFPSAFERNNRVDKVDYRIHFALNCGAKSCPPIAFYQPAQIDTQLDLATKSYLSNEVLYDETNNAISLPAFIRWFSGDFGGKSKVVELLQRLNIVPPGKRPAIEFRTYNWNLFLENYSSDI